MLSRVASVLGIAILLSAGLAGWIAFRANQVNAELNAATALIADFKSDIASKDTAAAAATIDRISSHTARARDAVEDPLWKLASVVPILGPNLSAVREVAVAADEVASGTAMPIAKIVSSLDWENLSPAGGSIDISPLSRSAPAIVSASNTLELTYSRLQSIDKSRLVVQVAVPLTEAMDKLGEFRGALRTASNVSRMLPAMMGSDEVRSYLVLVQNSAEVRATGGLPGSLALIRVDNGSIEFVRQESGSSIGRFTPPVPVDPDQTLIYSARLGTFISDVNLTPDFPTAARTAKAMWEARFGESIDGVVSIDAGVLGHILEASGPISVPVPFHPGLPASLTSQNVVRTLLSDAYRTIDSNQAQDVYFSAVSQEIFKVLVSGKAAGPALLKAVTQSFEENRIRVWSDHNDEQQILGDIDMGGATSGPSVGGAAFGVYFNDGTGAKMDYYVRRSVQLIEVCTNNDYAEYKVRISTTNTAPADAASSLPVSVTGDGRYGTPPGSVQTNVVVYGPAMSHVDTATADGQKVGFGSHLHGDRPVGIVTTRLAPGQSSEVEMSFVKVVQHKDPTLSVTPTVQEVKDVMLPTEYANCR
ncbi:DUF4012 domain-containing protein [Pseudarthrobacter sp. RMG13]|uniref:DUF4012 domain-containing protein n=1 Tax=Pseudarthrobacter humi TaxID=2952523 RepID=A0ABT1LS07_9MICC|nr:DUF4012 domain-containing protein [Pseudarthrobacter humi]MCP9001233.1 DUF4012 domain-containing protein [Pseudarthrobacter humi]